MAAHRISHIEIPGTDPQAAARFYGDLFGWQMVHDETYNYTMFDASPGPGGAYVAIDGQHARAGEVLVHVDTDDIDATLKQVGELGGQTLVPKTEVPGVVWFAVFADPSGNRIGLSSTIGDEAPPAPPAATAHPIVHVEIPANDPQAAGQFYNAIFGWQAQHDANLNYTMFGVESGPGGGFPQIDGQQTRSGQVTLYVATDDIEGTLNKATGLGAQVALPKMEIPGVGWMGVFSDPSGTLVGLYSEKG
jgi:predicted enzyme related to lactoylglutathione lyase